MTSKSRKWLRFMDTDRWWVQNSGTRLKWVLYSVWGMLEKKFSSNSGQKQTDRQTDRETHLRSHCHQSWDDIQQHRHTDIHHQCWHTGHWHTAPPTDTRPHLLAYICILMSTSTSRCRLSEAFTTSCKQIQQQQNSPSVKVFRRFVAAFTGSFNCYRIACMLCRYSILVGRLECTCCGLFSDNNVHCYITI